MNQNEKRDHLETMIQARKEIENLQVALHDSEALNERQEKTLDALRSEYRTFIDAVFEMRAKQKALSDVLSMSAYKELEDKVDKLVQDYKTREATLELPFG